MKLKSYLSLGAASIAVLAGANSANALQLGPGELGVDIANRVFFTENIIDFTVQNGVLDLGTRGTFVSTTVTPNIDPTFGIFGEDPLMDDTSGRSFVGADGRITDLIIDPTIALSLEDSNGNTGGGLENDVTYTISQLTGGAATQLEFLLFDTDGDDQIGVDNGDFSYFITTVTRRAEPGTDGGFDVAFDFDGFFLDGAGVYAQTPSVFSIFDGTSSVNPDELPIVSTDDFAATIAAGNGGSAASVDGTIVTEAANVPEPTSILSILALTGLAGGLLNKKNRK